MSVDHKRHAGDLLRPISITLLGEDQQPVQIRDGAGVPPTVTLKIRRSGASDWQAPERSVTVDEISGDSSTNGQLSYFPQVDDFDVPSIYETLFYFVWQGGEPEHFPREGYFIVEVEPS